MKKICSIILCLVVATGSVSALSPDQMTGWKTYLLNGNVKELSQSDGDALAFNKDGNLIKKTEQDFTSTYEYGDATHYLRVVPRDPYPYEITFKGNVRSEMWYNTTEQLGVTYTFDNNGRLTEKSEPGYGNSYDIEYFYNGTETLPYKILRSDYDMDWSMVTTSEYTYGKIDDNGNWTTCSIKIAGAETYFDENTGRERVNRTTNRSELTRTISYYSDSEMGKKEKYSKNVPMPDQKVKADKGKADKNKSGKQSGDKKGITVPDIIVIIVIILMLIHMIYVKFIGKPRYPQPFSVDGFAAKRAEAGLPQSASEAENKEADLLLDKAWESFSVITVESGEEFRKPMSAKEIRKADALIKEAGDFNPTDPEVVAEMNGLADVINSNTRKVFGGSWWLMVVGAAVGAIAGFTVELSILFLWLAFLPIYWLAAQIPAWLADKKMMKKVRNAPDATFNFMGEMIAQSKVVRTTITWNDNSKTVSNDYSEVGMSIVLTIMVIAVMGALLPMWSIFCYVRNYLLRR